MDHHDNDPGCAASSTSELCIHFASKVHSKGGRVDIAPLGICSICTNPLDRPNHTVVNHSSFTGQGSCKPAPSGRDTLPHGSTRVRKLWFHDPHPIGILLSTRQRGPSTLLRIEYFCTLWHQNILLCTMVHKWASSWHELS